MLGEGMILFLDRVTELLFMRKKKKGTKTKTPCNVPLAIGAELTFRKVIHLEGQL